MNIAEIQHLLTMLPNKRAFAARHKLPARTMWRIISGESNPTARTTEAFAAAITAERRRKVKA